MTPHSEWDVVKKNWTCRGNMTHRHVQEQEGDLSISRYIILIQSWKHLMDSPYCIKRSMPHKKVREHFKKEIKIFKSSHYSSKRLLGHWYFSKKKAIFLHCCYFYSWHLTPGDHTCSHRFIVPKDSCATAKMFCKNFFQIFQTHYQSIQCH